VYGPRAAGGEAVGSAAVVDTPYIPGERAAFERRPATGYAMVISAAVLFGVNGAVSKVALEEGLTSYRLAQIRCLGAFVILAALLLLTRPGSVRARAAELPFLALFGCCAVVLTQLTYFLAIRRLDIGVALLIIFLAPLLVALWARFVGREHVRRRVWAALALALIGLSLVVDVWGGVSLDGLGVTFALLGACSVAAYFLLAEHAVGRRDPLSLLFWGFLFASLLWAIVQPWWSFPFEVLGERVSLLGNAAHLHLPEWLLVTWVIVLGTIVPFILIVGSLRHLSATRVAICGMVEPVVATVLAFAWLDETLGAQQLVGGAVVLAGIFLAQTAR
jgi:drug/metabolite transporter (DMT)-like permease